MEAVGCVAGEFPEAPWMQDRTTWPLGLTDATRLTGVLVLGSGDVAFI
jgi:hypothetical protein